MMKNSFIRVFVCVLSICFLHKLTAQSNHIHVDQFGYLPTAAKVAVLSNPIIGYNNGGSYTAPAMMELKDAATGNVVFSAAPMSWDNGNMHDQSGDIGWWFDFSAVITEGSYYVYDPLSGEQSGTFDIDVNVYNDLLKDAGRMFYYNRCNATKAAPYAEANWTDGMNFMNALQDDNCRLYTDPNNAGLEKDLSGGWFDAGDNNKYVTFASSVVHDLLWAYKEYPNAFNDDWNIPESGNGIADIMDEVNWEIDWLKKMINTDGSAIIKMGNIDYADNALSPPSANTDQRYYGLTCTSASVAAAGMLAHAAQVYQDIPAFASEVADMQTQAIACFNYYLTALNANALELNCDDGTIKSGDADRNADQQKWDGLLAAVHLWELTGDASYNTYIINHINDAEPINNNWWGPYHVDMSTALLHYTTLPGADAATVSEIINSYTSPLSSVAFFGFNDLDLYRSYQPDWSYHWGSSNTKAKTGSMNNMVIEYNLDPTNNASYAQKASEQIHFFHGMNPMGLVLLSGMEGRGAERGIQEIYHAWFYDGTDWDNSSTSLYGPAPGFVTGGMNRDFSVTSLVPPANQPIQKSYLDFNDGFPNNSWEISEPAIYYQSAYIRLLASQVTNATILPVVYESPLRAKAHATSVELSWRVALEADAEYYEIQHRQANGTWASLGKVAANNQKKYTYWHNNPRSGENNYRLKQVDTNGQFNYSNVVSALFKNEYDLISIHPNPIRHGVLHINQLPAHCYLKIRDIQGRLIRNIEATAYEMEINVDDLKAGVYFIEIFDEGVGLVKTERVVKL